MPDRKLALLTVPMHIPSPRHTHAQASERSSCLFFPSDHYSSAVLWEEDTQTLRSLPALAPRGQGGEAREPGFLHHLLLWGQSSPRFSNTAAQASQNPLNKAEKFRS